jgi:hypothetical protein
MLCGEQWPGLGGAPEYLDVLGINYYSNNQWYHGDGRTIERGNPITGPSRASCGRSISAMGDPC